MLSNFGRADGGRETWAYNFIPRLLARHPSLQLRIYGLTVDGEPDNTPDLIAAVAERDRTRMSIEFARSKADRLPNAVSFFTGLARLADREAPEPAFVLAVGSFIELLAVLVSARFKTSEKIVWLRTIFLNEKAHRIPRAARPLLRLLEDWALRRADLLIANGEDTAAHYRERGLAVEVLPNAVDFARWRMPPVMLDGAQLKIAYVGRLARVKGIREFLAAAAILAADPDNAAEFHVVGEGPEMGLVKAATDEHGVNYHGAIPNDVLPDLLKTFDVCVALTFHSPDGGTSGLSNALLEQMAAGRVIIAWDNTIFRQILNLSNAYLVPQSDAMELASAVRAILADPGVAKERARTAQKDAMKRSFENHMDRFDELVVQRFTALR